ncbi:MAG: hypothetical protein ACE5I5_08735 [Candidatus Heimdallarchaeota archaeon]
MKKKVKRMDWNEFWEHFETASYEEKLSIFHEYLSGSTEIVSDMIFEVILELLTETRRREDYKTFADLVERVQTMHPEIYRDDAPVYNMYLIENMARQGEFKNLSIVLEPFAQSPRHIDELIRVMELLIYHSQTGPLLKVMQEAYPKIMYSPEIIPSGKHEFAYFLGMLIIIDGLERGVDRNELHSVVSKYWNVNKTYLENLVARLQGEISESWRREEFLKGSLKKRKMEERIINLLIDYMRWLTTDRGMSFGRALLARDSLVEYLLGRQHYSRVKKGRHLLLPLLVPLRKHHRSFKGIQPYQVVSLVETLPLYYEYLLYIGLIGEMELKRELEIMKSLKKSVMKYFRGTNCDKEILSSIEEAWKDC